MDGVDEQYLEGTQQTESSFPPSQEVGTVESVSDTPAELPAVEIEKYRIAKPVRKIMRAKLF
jgi:hypothetical protein